MIMLNVTYCFMSLVLTFQVSTNNVYLRVSFKSFSNNFILFRLAWCIAVGGSFCLLSYLLLSRLLYLYEYPTVVNVQVKNVQQLPFPMVTVCNQNMLRSVNMCPFSNTTLCHHSIIRPVNMCSFSNTLCHRVSPDQLMCVPFQTHCVIIVSLER